MLPNQEEVFGKPPRCFGQHVPSNLSLTCKKQQAKACWKCCKNTKYVTENFCFYTEISSKQIRNIKLIFDLSKTVNQAEKYMEMDAEI
jgi:hypothetical protein